jgi:hypothetical protein
MSAQLVSSPLFSLLSAASPPVDITMPPRRVTLPSYGAKTSLLPPLHLSAMLHYVTSRLEQKLKH